MATDGMGEQGTHRQYLEFVQTYRATLKIKVPYEATALWCKFRRADLSAAQPILTRLYDVAHGRPAWAPDELLRAWLLMLECHITSVDIWVQRLREQPFYALLCGFAPDHVPGVGTFYDFQDRLLQIVIPVLNRDAVPRQRSEQRKTSGALRDKNNTAPHAQILDRLAERLMTRPARTVLFGQWHTNLATLPAYQRPLKEVFYSVFVATSMTKGLVDLTYLPRLLRVDARAAAREAEEANGGGGGRLPGAGTEAAYAMKRVAVDVRAYRVEADGVAGLSVRDLSLRADVPLLQVLRGDQVLDPAQNPLIQRGDVVTVVTDVARLLAGGPRLGPEVADERARGVDLEVADLVVTRREFEGMTLGEASARFRRMLAPGGEPVGRLFHPLALFRAGEPIPFGPGSRVERGDCC